MISGILGITTVNYFKSILVASKLKVIQRQK